jgi:nucleotide sugar dehydrogenase
LLVAVTPALRQRVKVAFGVMSRDVAIVGAGYVGMPLAQAFAEAGKTVVLVDVSEEVVDGINRGESHIGDVSSKVLKKLVDAGSVAASSDYGVLEAADAILIALPTPLSSQREPDLSIVKSAVEQIAPRLRQGHVVVLESTTYPGTTREIVQPILESGGLKAGTSTWRSHRSGLIPVAATGRPRTRRSSSAGSLPLAPSARPSSIEAP